MRSIKPLLPSMGNGWEQVTCPVHSRDNGMVHQVPAFVHRDHPGLAVHWSLMTIDGDLDDACFTVSHHKTGHAVVKQLDTVCLQRRLPQMLVLLTASGNWTLDGPSLNRDRAMCTAMKEAAEACYAMVGIDRSFSRRNGISKTARRVA